MRVFVAGATGVVGWRAVSQLVAAGHDVSGIARTPEKAEFLERLGARPVTVSLFDAAALRDAVAGHAAVVNLATKIPPLSQMARMSAWAENERIRREGSHNLVDAAIAGGASVFVQESLAFLYGEHGDELIDAASAEQVDSQFAEAVRVAEANVARFSKHGGRGVVLRYGRFYAADSTHSEEIVRYARRGFALDVGDGGGFAPMIDADDAAAAVGAALSAPAGTYDIVDDVPLRRREQDAALAAAVGRRRVHRAPPLVTPKAFTHLSGSQRVSNARFRAATGWQPSSPSVREGWKKVATQLRVEPSLPGRVRLVLWLLALSAAAIGIQAAFTPRSFYDDFPFGRGWVAMNGPYSEHLIRDVGALNLGLLVLTLGALWIGTRAVARLAAATWFVWSVPHLVYHLRHPGMAMAGADKGLSWGSLALNVVFAVLVWIWSRPVRVPGAAALTQSLRRPPSRTSITSGV
jgi:nucleoside-diphosphate-sugar epimerase